MSNDFIIYTVAEGHHLASHVAIDWFAHVWLNQIRSLRAGVDEQLLRASREKRLSQQGRGSFSSVLQELNHGALGSVHQ